MSVTYQAGIYDEYIYIHRQADVYINEITFEAKSESASPLDDI